MSSTRSLLVHAFELLEPASTVEACRRALTEALQGAAPDSEAARFLVHRSHLIARGGERTLAREALAADDDEIREVGEELAARCEPPLRLFRCAGTRPYRDGRVRTIETGGNYVQSVQFSADGAHLYTFVRGLIRYVDVYEDEEEDPSKRDEDFDDWELDQRQWRRQAARDGAARFQVWHVASGELVGESFVGKFRGGEGRFAVSPDGQTLVVSHDLEFEIYALPSPDGWARGEEPRHRYRLPCGQELGAVDFLDDRRVLVNDCTGELAVWDTHTGERLAYLEVCGYHAVVEGGARLWLARTGKEVEHAVIERYALPSLTKELSCVAADGVKRRCHGIAVSPQQRVIATTDVRYGRTAEGRLDPDDSDESIYLWPLGDLAKAARAAEPEAAAPRSVSTVRLATTVEHVSALRFLDEQRLLSGHHDGSIADRRFALDGTHAARTLYHPGIIVTGLRVHPGGEMLASAAYGGRIMLWELNGQSRCPPRDEPAGRGVAELKRHPDGIEIIVEDKRVVVPLPPEVELDPPLSVDGPRQLGLEQHETFGFHSHDDRNVPPYLMLMHKYRVDGRVLDEVQLEDEAFSRVTLDARTFAVLVDGYLEFYRLR